MYNQSVLARGLMNDRFNSNAALVAALAKLRAHNTQSK